LDPQDHTLRGTACRTGRSVGNRRVGLENPPTSRGAQTNYCRRNFGIPGLSATHSARRSDTDTWATSVTPASHRRIPPWGPGALPYRESRASAVETYPVPQSLECTHGAHQKGSTSIYRFSFCWPRRVGRRSTKQLPQGNASRHTPGPTRTCWLRSARHPFQPTMQ